MIMAINFQNTYERQFPVKDLRQEYDVRALAATSTNAVDELVSQGVKRLPIVTEDGVYIDGRTGGEALIELAVIRDGVRPSTIPVLVVKNIYWSKASNASKREIRAESLRRNLGTYRVFATGEDIELVIRDLKISGAHDEEVVTLLSSSYLSKDRIKNFLKGINQQIEQQKISAATNYLRDHPDSTPTAVARKFNVKNPESLVVGKRLNTKGQAQYSFKAMKKAQHAAERALEAVQRYGKTNLESLRKGGRMTGKVAVELAEYQFKTLIRAAKKAEEVYNNTVKEVETIIPGTHRF
jgi:hypothetical protein